MGINTVQFQKGLSMVEFMNRYGTQEKCHAAVVTQRWPAGFVCPDCGETRHCTFERKGLMYWRTLDAPGLQYALAVRWKATRWLTPHGKPWRSWPGRRLARPRRRATAPAAAGAGGAAASYLSINATACSATGNVKHFGAVPGLAVEAF